MEYEDYLTPDKSNGVRAHHADAGIEWIGCRGHEGYAKYIAVGEHGLSDWDRLSSRRRRCR